MIDKILYGTFALILLYIVSRNANAVNNTLNHLSTATTNAVSALQGN